MKTIAFAACLGLVFALPVRADDESGPKAGEKVAKLTAFGVVGTVEKKEADFAAERKDAPTIYLFVAAQEGGLPVGGRPAARFMKKLDEEIGKVDGAAIEAHPLQWVGLRCVTLPASSRSPHRISPPTRRSSNPSSSRTQSSPSRAASPP